MRVLTKEDFKEAVQEKEVQIKKRKKVEKVSTCIRFDPDLYEKMKLFCAKKNINLCDLINKILRNFFEEIEAALKNE